MAIKKSFRRQIAELVWGKGRTKIEIYQSTEDHKWYWRARGGNTEKIAQAAQGQGYETKQMCEKGLLATKKAFEEFNVIYL